MKTINYDEFQEDAIVLVDISTVPDHMQMDFRTRNENLEKGRVLCKRCDGTGNQLLSMFQLCEDCLGKGHGKVAKIKSDLSAVDHDALEKFIRKAYLSSTRIHDSLLGERFTELGWLANGLAAYGVREYTGHDGKPLYAIYVARKELTKSGKPVIKPYIQANTLMPMKKAAKEYVEGLKKTLEKGIN